MLISLSLAVTIAVVILAVGLWLDRPVQLPGKVAVIVENGDRAREIGHKLEREGVIRSRTAFLLLARWKGIDRHLQPGRYEFEGNVRLGSVLQDLELGRAVTVSVTIPEGWTIAQIVPHLARELGLNTDSLSKKLREPSLLREWAPDAPSLEGYLWPETYRFYWGVEPKEVILTMLRESKAAYGDSLQARAATMGMTRHQIMTLASMIEAEASNGAERARISGVFHNRLEKEWPLQCDPTVVYAMGGLDGERPLQTTDLDFDSPFNTYLHIGLPPGPICNPGIASVLAALYPDRTDEMYFVADGKGAHVFSRTLDEHNTARARVKQDMNRRR